MSKTDQDVMTVVKAFLTGKPGVLPTALEGDTEEVKKPWQVLTAEGGEFRHPKLRSLILSLEVQVDGKDTTPAIATGLLETAAAMLTAGGLELDAGLRPYGLRLRKFHRGIGGGVPEGERVKLYEERWSVWVEIVPISGE